ncbi:MAG: HEAT repeat domain-containing protein [Planctomycetota bacterium]|jgi:hypothetical protein
MKKRKSCDTWNNDKLERRSRKLVHRFNDPRDVKAISKLSYDESYVVSKYYLVHELVKIGRAAIPSLLNAIKDKNHLVRELVVRTLGEIGDESITPTLIKLLRKDEQRRVQQGTIRALQKINRINFTSQKRLNGKAQQREVVNKWLNWWKENKTEFNGGSKQRRAVKAS